MLKFYFIFPLLFLYTFCIWAQENLRGKVLDEQTKEELYGAYVFLKNEEGETLSSTFTDFDGTFQIKRPADKSFIVEVSYIGYSTIREKRVGPEGNNLGTFLLMSEGQELEAFEIQADALRGEVRGDTVAFNAAAFRTRPEADADELVRKMPGVVIQNGVVEVQGEQVMEVLVDGRPFFGDNPAAALKNLPAEVVDRIEFLDRRSDEAQLTGYDDGETIKTINIITKEDKRSGQFGKFYGGYGTDNNYIAGGNLNLF